MATAWRASSDPLSRYIASMTTTEAAAAAAEEEDQDAGHPDMHEDPSPAFHPAEGVEDENQPPPIPPPAHANDNWWPRLRGRLARQGIVVSSPPDPTCHPPIPSTPPPAFLALLQDLERFHTHLRAIFRLLHGSLALRCGRGISVPMVPLMSLHPTEVEVEEEARVHAVVMPALRATLLQSLGRASRALVAAAALGGREEGDNDEGWKQGKKVIASLMLLLRQGEEEEEEEQQQQQQQQRVSVPTTSRKGVTLLHLQTAFHAWGALVGECLPRLLSALQRREDGREEEVEEGQEQDATGHLAQVLREEGACLAAAFGLHIPPPLSSSPPPSSSTTTTTTANNNNNSSRHPHKIKSRLQAIGHRLSLRRAAAEARLARVFLQQCALVVVLRTMKEEEEEEEGREEGGALCGGLERLYEVLTEGGREEGVQGQEGGLEAEADVVEVRSMLQALMKEAGREGRVEGGGGDGSIEARSEACVVLEERGGGGAGGEGAGLKVSKQEEKREYATIEKEEMEGGKEGGREDEDDPYLEVFEGRAGAEFQPDEHSSCGNTRHKSKAAAAAAAAAAVIEHDALIGELGRVLHHRERQRPAATRVKVNGQMLLMASSSSSLLLLEEEDRGVGREGNEEVETEEGGRRMGGRMTTTLSRDGGAGEVSCGIGAALLAAVLQQQRGQGISGGGDGYADVEVFDGEGEGEEEVEGEEGL